MRLALALAALVVASPAGAAVQKCMAHVHKGADNYMQDGDFAPMHPEKHVGPHLDVSTIDDEVDYLDTQTPGGPFVYRLHDFAFRLRDVDLYGDCTKMRVNDPG